MPTATEVKRQKAATRAQREREARTADRARLKTLVGHLRGAAVHGRARRREVVALCRRARTRDRDRAKALRAATRAEIETTRARSRAECEARKIQARSKGLDSVARAAAVLSAERKHQDTMRRFSGSAKALGPKRRSTRAADARAESDSEVAANIPAELEPVWRAVRGRMHATARRTRTEAFLEWAQEHPADVIAILDRQYERDVAALAKEEGRLRKLVSSPRAYRRATDHELQREANWAHADAVPF